MKVTLYMAVTINGFIAKENDDTSWVTGADWKKFKEISKRIGNVIIGRRTYKVMLREKQFPLGDCLNIVLTEKKTIKNRWKNVLFTNQSPKQVLKYLKRKGFKETLIAGGGKINGSFIKENLIDEIYLTIEPIVFGKGIKLFNDADFETKLKLIKIAKISNNEIQVHYRIKK